MVYYLEDVIATYCSLVHPKDPDLRIGFGFDDDVYHLPRSHRIGNDLNLDLFVYKNKTINSKEIDGEA